MRIAISENARTPPHILEELSIDEDAAVRRVVVRSNRLSRDLVSALLLDEDQEVRTAARRVLGEEGDQDRTESHEANSTTRSIPWTTAQMQEMAAHSSARVRLRLAISEHVTPDILTFLGGERRSLEVRRAVAAHPKTPPDVLRSLAVQDDCDTLKSVAFNPGTPFDVLVGLAGRNAELAVLAALNPDAPLKVLEALTTNSDPFVKFVAEAQIQERLKQIQMGMRV
ncbi:MAG: hypothetical protein ACK5LO_17440 [Leucobacter sp.]